MDNVKECKTYYGLFLESSLKKLKIDMTEDE